MEQYRYGKHAVIASMQAGKAKKIFLLPSFKDADVMALIHQHHLSVERIEEARLAKLVQSQHHQGIVALVAPFTYTPLPTFLTKIASQPSPLLVLLDGLEDPLNLGAIIRTAVGFGVDGFIIKKDRQVDVNATVAKIASGALDHLPIIQVTNLTQTIETLKQHRFWIVATSLVDAVDFRSVDFHGPMAIIIGHEGNGISRLVLDHADFKVKIPIQTIESFNAATSTAIVLSEVQRQRLLPKK